MAQSQYRELIGYTPKTVQRLLTVVNKLKLSRLRTSMPEPWWRNHKLKHDAKQLSSLSIKRSDNTNTSFGWLGKHHRGVKRRCSFHPLCPLLSSSTQLISTEAISVENSMIRLSMPHTAQAPLNFQKISFFFLSHDASNNRHMIWSGTTRLLHVVATSSFFTGHLSSYIAMSSRSIMQ